MADLTKTIEVIFAGVDNIGPTTQSIGRELNSLQSSVGSVTAPVADFTKKILATEVALISAGVAATSFAVIAAGEFDSAFREISTLINEPIENLDEFRQAILDYSSRSSKPLEQVTSAIYNAISAGIDYRDAIQAVAQAEQLSIAGKADLNDSLVVLVSTLNAYGLGMDQAQRFSDLLFQTVRSGQTTLPELSASLASVSGLAATAGVDFDELLAAIATLTATGTPTSQAITQVQGAIAALLKPTGPAANEAARLGIEFNAQRLAAVGLEGVLEDVRNATGGNAESMSLLFGRVEALNGMLTLTGLGADKFTETLEDMRGSAGATAIAYDKMADDIGLAQQRVANAFRGLLVDFGSPLLNESAGIADAIAKIFQAIGANIQGGQLGEFVKFIESQLGGLAANLEGIAKAIPDALTIADLGGLQRGLEAVRDSVSGLFGDLDLSKPEDLARVIEFLVNSFETLSNVTAGAVSALGPFIQTAFSVLESITQTDGGLQNLAGNLLGLTTGVNALLPLLGGLGSTLTTVGGAMAVVGGAKSIGAVNLGVGGLVGLLSGPVGLVALTGAAAAGLYLWNDSLQENRQALRAEIAEIEAATALMNQAFDGADNFGDVAINMQRLGIATKDVSREFEIFYGITLAQAAAYDNLEDALSGISASNAAAADAAREEAEARRQAQIIMREQTGYYDKLVEATIKETRQSELAAKSQADLAAEYRAMTVAQQVALEGWERDAYWMAVQAEEAKNAAESNSEVRNSLDDLADTFEKQIALRRQAADELFKEQKQLMDYQLALEELASNERIRALELSFEIDLEQLRSQTEIAKSIIGTIDTAITSTGETLSSLFETLASGNLNRFQELDLQKVIQSEETRRQQTFEQQRELTASQIKQMAAQTKMLEERARSLARGDAMIQVDGAGLQQHLEAFMWEILRTIQVRVNQDGLGMLLGTYA